MLWSIIRLYLSEGKPPEKKNWIFLRHMWHSLKLWIPSSNQESLHPKQRSGQRSGHPHPTLKHRYSRGMWWLGVVVQSLSHVWLFDPMDCSLRGSSVHGVSQARILEWVAISFSRESSRPRDQTQVSRLSGGLFTEPRGKPSMDSKGPWTYEVFFLNIHYVWIM